MEFIGFRLTNFDSEKPPFLSQDSDDEDDWYAQNLRLRKQRESWKPKAGSWVRLSNLQRARHLEPWKELDAEERMSSWSFDRATDKVVPK